VEAVDQSAVISICCVVMPTIDAADVDAPRVECAVKTEVPTGNCRRHHRRMRTINAKEEVIVTWLLSEGRGN